MHLSDTEKANTLSNRQDNTLDDGIHETETNNGNIAATYSSHCWHDILGA